MLQKISQRKKISFPYKPLRQTAVVRSLQTQIANAFNLYLNYKHYHWQTFGPFERDLNIIFDEFANDVYSTVEQLAEKVRMMEQNRVRIKEFRENATVKPAKRGRSIRGMIEEAEGNVSKVIAELNEIIALVSEKNPALSVTLEKILRIHEKHHWWLHYILNKRHGLAD